MLRNLALTFVVPAAALLPVVMPSQPQGLLPSEAAALRAHFDPSLGSLRAGAVAMPAPLGEQERAELSVAQQQSSSLSELRAGSAPTQNEWTWLALGMIVVLLIVLL